MGRHSVSNKSAPEKCETTEPDEEKVNKDQETRRSSRRIKRPLKLEPEISVVVKRTKKEGLPQHLSRNQYLPETKLMNSGSILRSICYICPEKFEDFPALGHHQKQVHPMECAFCQTKFWNYENGVKAHLKSYHQVKKGNLSKYKGFEFCSLCMESFDDFKTLRAHAAKFHPHHCPECWVEFETKYGTVMGASMVNTHYKEVHQMVNSHYREMDQMDQKMYEAAKKILKMRGDNKLPTNPLEEKIQLIRNNAVNQAKVTKSKVMSQAKVVKPELWNQARVAKPKRRNQARVVKPERRNQARVVKPKRRNQARVVKPELSSQTEIVVPKQEIQNFEEHENRSDHLFEITEGVKLEAKKDELQFVKTEFEEVSVKEELVADEIAFVLSEDCDQTEDKTEQDTDPLS